MSMKNQTNKVKFKSWNELNLNFFNSFMPSLVYCKRWRVVSHLDNDIAAYCNETRAQLTRTLKRIVEIRRIAWPYRIRWPNARDPVTVSSRAVESIWSFLRAFGPVIEVKY